MLTWQEFRSLELNLKEKKNRMGKMGQRVKVLAAKPDPRTYMEGGREFSPASCPLAST